MIGLSSPSQSLGLTGRPWISVLSIRRKRLQVAHALDIYQQQWQLWRQKKQVQFATPLSGLKISRATPDSIECQTLFAARDK